MLIYLKGGRGLSQQLIHPTKTFFCIFPQLVNCIFIQNPQKNVKVTHFWIEWHTYPFIVISTAGVSSDAVSRTSKLNYHTHEIMIRLACCLSHSLPDVGCDADLLFPCVKRGRRGRDLTVFMFYGCLTLSIVALTRVGICPLEDPNWRSVSASVYHAEFSQTVELGAVCFLSDNHSDTT